MRLRIILTLTHQTGRGAQEGPLNDPQWGLLLVKSEPVIRPDLCLLLAWADHSRFYCCVLASLCCRVVIKLQLKLLQTHADQVWWFRAARLSRALLSRCSAPGWWEWHTHCMYTVCCSHQLRRSSEFKVFCLQRCPPAKWLFELLLWLKAVCPFSCDINKVLPPRKLLLSRCFLRFRSLETQGWSCGKIPAGQLFVKHSDQLVLSILRLGVNFSGSCAFRQHVSASLPLLPFDDRWTKWRVC